MRIGENIYKIDEQDNVAVALEDIPADSVFEHNEPIGKNHKIALCDIPAGGKIVKYGNVIGIAENDIGKGDLVHTHNIRSEITDSFAAGVSRKCSKVFFRLPSRSFWGYRRSDGEVGIRNEVYIVPTVGCINHSAERIASHFQGRSSENFDGVTAFTHNCGCSQLSEDLENTQKILKGIVKHPNASGVLVLSLGCENNNISEFKKILGKIDERRVRFLTAQECGDEVAEGIKIVEDLIAEAERQHREECGIEKLRIGVKCGGSDSLSGITANVLVGEFSDSFIAGGGNIMMTEVPEIFGAEHILEGRIDDEKVRSDFEKLIRNFKKYYVDNDQPMDRNPSPGNHAGGISTLAEKSLGCIQKSGHNEITDVLAYGGSFRKKGLTLIEAPGNDMISQTALAAGGAQLILFTTGRGTPLGASVPTVKISTNSDLYRKKRAWIDFDAGVLLDGQREGVAERFYNYIFDVINGQKTNNEVNGFKEISIWKTGVTL